MTDEFIVRETAPMYIPHDAVIFKMPPYSEIYSKELLETAHSFWREGILKPPFKNVIFQMLFDAKAGESFMYRVHVSGEEKSMECNKNRLFVRGASCVSKNGKDPIYCFHSYKYIVDCEKIHAFFIPKHKNDRDHFSKESTENLADHVVGIAFVCMLVSSMPQFERTEIERPQKLQRARERRGKDPLRRMIQIRLRPEIRAAYEKNGSSCVVMKPHWRRGHIRRLSSDRYTTVSPCLVNFDGVYVEPKKYNVISNYCSRPR